MAMDFRSAKQGMGTVITSRVCGAHGEEALKAAEQEAARLEGLLSRFIPASDICRVNRSAGIRHEEVSCETYEVLSRAYEFSKISQGCFDVTIGPLADLWKGCLDAAAPPNESEIRLTLPLVNNADLHLIPRANTVGLIKTSQSIDLGGIGKGYAADRITDVFNRYGVSSAYTNLGGNVATIGAKPDGSPWVVGIQHPRQEHSIIGYVSAVNQSVVTSGDYQRFFIGSNGKRYHHILDPATGYPAQSGLLSVTVVAGSSMAADALSTILFVAGMEKGLELLKLFPGTEAVFIDTNFAVYLTRGLHTCFQAGEGIRARNRL